MQPYEPTMPSLRNYRRGWWATVFADFEAAVRWWALFNTEAGYTTDEAIELAVAWATKHGYHPEGYQPVTYSGSKIKDIKAQNRIEDVAARLTELRGNGKAMRGKCPIHKGNNPGAFVVWPEIQRAKCYNCGFSGDVIDLLKVAGIDAE